MTIVALRLKTHAFTHGIVTQQPHTQDTKKVATSYSALNHRFGSFRRSNNPKEVNSYCTKTKETIKALTLLLIS